MYHHYSHFWTRWCMHRLCNNESSCSACLWRIIYNDTSLWYTRSSLLSTIVLLEKRPPKDAASWWKIVLVKFEREIERIPIYDFCTAKTYEKSFRPFVRTNSVFLTRAVRKNVRQMSDRQSPSHHIPTSSYVGLLLILISHVSAVHFAYASVRRRADRHFSCL